MIGDSEVTVTQPAMAMFVCTAMARPRPFITWYRVEMDNSHTAIAEDEEGVAVAEVDGSTDRIFISTLIFEPSRPFFSAEYICEATNVVASAETNAILMVYGKERGRKSGCVDVSFFLFAVSPVVMSVMNYTVNLTDTATFQCVATGIPAPSITWFRNGTELNSTTDPRVTLNNPSDAVTVADGAGENILQVTRTLSLSMSVDEDSGSYECRASNDATPGEDRESFELVVQSKSCIAALPINMPWMCALLHSST